MAEGTTLAVSSVGDRRRFEQILVKALRSRGNLLILAKCAAQLQLHVVEQRARTLVTRGDIITDIDRGKALWELLKEAIERLRPANTDPKPTPAWRLYAIAEGVYIRGESAGQMAVELAISQRTFHRERRAAVEAVATVMWQIEGQMRSGDAAY